MLLHMNEHRHHWVGDLRVGHRSLSISCDDCSLQCTDACTDCVVTYVLRASDERDDAAREVDGLALDCDEARVVRLFGKAGLVPELKFQVADSSTVVR
jgi:hypothetical protein